VSGQLNGETYASALSDVILFPHSFETINPVMFDGFS
jgi:aspartyl/asparaginyl-tRNA synthetase